MKRTLAQICAPVLLIASTSACSAAGLPAFPGAEGFGAGSIGGRGGQVIKVTNLRTRGPGSLQAACRAEGPRLVVFDVSGVIPGDVVIEHGRISIMGQTAPGAGVTIAGMLSTRYNPPQPIDDIVVRFIRVRPTAARGSGGDAIQFSQASRVILDQVSCSWACDETIDIYSARDVTVQWCTIEESAVAGHPEGRHNYGLISGPRGERVSIHHNLFAHHARRCPAIANGPSDVRNNVVYNFRDGLSHEGHPPNDDGFNLIGNYYKRGPSDAKIFPFCFRGDVAYYLRDNFIEGVGIIQDPWAEAEKLPGLKYYARHGRKAADEFPVAKVKTHSPKAACRLVLRRAGCFPRDAVTRRIIREVRTGTGAWGRPETAQTKQAPKPHPAPKDSDDDGMPDAWEAAHGLDANDGSDHGQTMKPGYTAIETYCHELAREKLNRVPQGGGLQSTSVASKSERPRHSTGEYAGHIWHIDENGLMHWDGKPYVRFGFTGNGNRNEMMKAGFDQFTLMPAARWTGSSSATEIDSLPQIQLSATGAGNGTAVGGIARR